MNALALCAYRTLSLPTFKAIVDVLASTPNWRVVVETGDALISRARSTVASQWLRNYPDDDILVMTDDDFYFTPAALESVAQLAREKRGIAAGVTPLRSGEYTAIVPFDASIGEPWCDPVCPPLEIKWAGGLIAYHRSVFETLTHALPLLHRNDRIAAFWPFFAPAMTSVNGHDIYLSEDYACHERARKAGFSVWVQPACQVQHLAEIPVSSATMQSIRPLFNEQDAPAALPVGSLQDV